MRSPRPRSLAAFLLAWMLAAAAPSPRAVLAAQSEAEKLSRPLPLEVAVSLRSHNGRSSVALSPDGRWLVHTVEGADTMTGDGGRFSTTGVPFAEGDSRMEATLTDTASGESTPLAGADASCWGPVLSPDGRKVAFYSDEGGEAGLWIWDVESSEKERVPGIVVRPFFGFELPAWSADGARLLVKLLPEGSTIAEANQLGARSFGRSLSRFPEVEKGQASVIVRRFQPSPAKEEESESDEEKPPTDRQAPVGDVDRDLADLAIVDLSANRVERVVRGEAVRFYAFSPGGSRIAYTVLKGFEPATQQPNYDLRVLALADGSARTVGENLRLSYGIEWSWSPAGRHLAYIPSGQMARRAASEGSSERIVLISVGEDLEAGVEEVSAVALGETETPSFDPGDGELPPYWSPDGQRVYLLADGELWQADLSSRQITKLAALDGWRIRALVVDRRTSTVWTGGGDGSLWAVARDAEARSSSICRIDASSGEVRVVHEEPKSYYGTFNVAAAPASTEIAFVATGLREPADIWILDTDSAEARQASHLNRDLERYELGSARLLSWYSLDGEPLRGALLLPPGAEEGSALPLVVWVYGGSMGSRAINTFGLWGSLPTFNMHLLATRGYAVLFPDAPLRPGTPVRDLMATVMPGVNAAIEAGWADPERLAIMGQSYGSYNTLAIITETDRFRAAIITAVVLHPDLFTDYLRNIGYYEQGQGNMGGTIWEEADRFLENSPLFRFDRIETPLLIGQGENDGDLEPAEAIFTALERLGKPVEYRLYEGEGHVLSKRANVVDFWQRRLEFLAEHLDLEVDSHGAVRAASDVGSTK